MATKTTHRHFGERPEKKQICRAYAIRQIIMEYLKIRQHDFVLNVICNLTCLRRTPDGVSAVCRRPRLRRCPSITMSAGRITEERFDPESTKFTWTSIPKSSIAAPDLISLAASPVLSNCENSRKCRHQPEIFTATFLIT